MEGLLQPTHLFFILLIVLIIFGPGKLPELGRGLGKGIREFKDAMKGGLSDSSDNKTVESKGRTTEGSEKKAEEKAVQETKV
jgi:sec-independent protein translocase protein TatA